jgi:Predicted membrane protein
MDSQKNNFAKRFIMMLTGILFIGVCVGSFRLSAFGVDAFTCMNLGISGFLHMSFGTWQLMMNTVILIVIFFTVRRCIGLGTIVNMVCVGYLADFIC